MRGSSARAMLQLEVITWEIDVHQMENKVEADLPVGERLQWNRSVSQGCRHLQMQTTGIEEGPGVNWRLLVLEAVLLFRRARLKHPRASSLGKSQ